MNKITYLIALLVLILAGCSGNSSTSTDPDESSSSVVNSSSSITSSTTTDGSSSSIAVIPPMSNPTSSSSITQSITSSTTGSSSATVAKAPIALFKMGALRKTTSVIDEMNALPFDIDLDTITMTTSIYFLIKNNSESEITGLKFAFDKPYFKITPDSIISLGVPSGATGVEQLIKVTVEHGTLATGLGWTDILTGNQYGKLTISGTNADGDFSTTYTMHVFAKRMVAYIDVPDTIYPVGDFWYNAHNYKFEMAPNINKVQPYIYVDNASKGCYVNYYASNLTLTDTDTLSYSSDREFYNDDNTNTFISDSTEDLHTQTSRESLLLNIYLNDTQYEYNCVTYVIDTRTGGISKMLK